MDQLKVTTNSTARALRTAYQTLVALIGAVPAIVGIFALIPSDTSLPTQVTVALGNMVVWSGIAAKVLNALEDSGVIPAPWKQTTVIPTEATNPGFQENPTAKDGKS